MFVSGCDGSDLVRPGGPTAAQLDELASEADRVFAILEAAGAAVTPLRTPSSSRVPPSRGTLRSGPEGAAARPRISCGVPRRPLAIVLTFVATP